MCLYCRGSNCCQYFGPNSLCNCDIAYLDMMLAINLAPEYFGAMLQEVCCFCSTSQNIDAAVISEAAEAKPLRYPKLYPTQECCMTSQSVLTSLMNKKQQCPFLLQDGVPEA